MSHTNPPQYWRSLGELADTPEFRAHLEAEFPTKDSPEGFSRRRMLQLMGASMVLATAGSCRWKEREELPFNKRPENRTPGKFERYATAMELGGTVLGLLVTCVDGRPIKVEGNPKHPNSLGATNAYAQAAILELYDPDRSRHIIEKTPQGDQVRSWEQFSEFAKKHFEEYRKNGGEGLAILSEKNHSRTECELEGKFAIAFPKAKICKYHPFVIDEDLPQYDFSNAKIIVCLDADILGLHPNSVKYARQFAKTRAAAGERSSRLYVIESNYSITGAMADHRLALPSTEIAKLPRVLCKAIENDHSLIDLEKRLPIATFQFIKAIVTDLKSNRRKSIVVVGSECMEELGNDILFLNSALDNLGRLVQIRGYVASNPSTAKQEIDLGEFVNLMKRGDIKTLLVQGCNPAYDSPAELEFTKAFKQVSNIVHLGLYRNETSAFSHWHVPQSHVFESWNDLLMSEGCYSVQQPMLEPLYGGKSRIELLSLIVGDENHSPLDMLRASFKKLVSSRQKEIDVEKTWRETLHEGIHILPNSDLMAVPGMSDFISKGLAEEYSETSTEVSSNDKNAPVPVQSISNGQLEITFRPSPAVYDGRFANLSWLQEMPDPITRLTWDNVAIFSPATAEKLGVKHEEIVKLKFKGREIEIPAYILPGQADGSVAVTLGYGRTAAGKVGGSEKDGVAPVGVNTYKLRTSDAMWFGTGLTVEPTGRMHQLASVAEHFAINRDRIGEHGRQERLGELVREATLAEYQKDPDFAKKIDHHPPLESLWEEHKNEGHRWGLTVDLSKCVGCGACVVACMAENNVPVVGKERIFKNREMHWLRIDRYFRGDAQNPQIVFQPVMCQQCEMAPCEGVCPVGATAHSKEGLNDMVYNRCVGTRYCANNCPYKVRRFNFFNYHKQYEDPANEVLKMASNPEVTVRMRGVMEKCTYCVQRIQAAKIEAKNEKREIRDGEIRTACQQVCPAGAIIFGDLSDKNSAVSRSLADDRSYQMLGELNTKPRTAYLARIRNPNPELEKAEKIEGNHHGGTEGTE
ncbi:MAG: TAT-variant-translocated molybdopterin oxidoreductase [Pirellulales bacterium]|nr:TAT-variant-translocated molybdopterin oxidoreductase [Pirellulales bacterium]